MTVFTSATLEIEYTPSTWTDVTSSWRGTAGLSIRRGRATIFDEIGGAKLTCVLDNPTGAFMPTTQVLEGKRIRVRVTKGATTYTRFVGPIQSADPVFDGPSLAQARVNISATDGLGLLDQRELRSNWTETALWRGRADACHVDAWEPSGPVSGYFPVFRNFSDDATSNNTVYVYVGSPPPLQFSTEESLSVGQTMTVAPNSVGDSLRAGWGLQTGNLEIQFLLKTPQSVAGAGVNYSALTFYNSAGSIIGYLGYDQNFANTAFNFYDSGFSNIGFLGNLPFGQWVHVRMFQNAGTATLLDASMNWIIDGTTTNVGSVGLDIRNIARVEFPGDTHARLDSGFGGLIALATTTPILYRDAFQAGSGSYWNDRMDSLFRACSQLPLTTSVSSTLPSSVYPCNTGVWSDRTALQVGQEIMRAPRGMLWARPWDGQVSAVGHDLLRPQTPVITIGAESELIGNPQWEYGVDQAPTRVLVTSPSRTHVAIDRDAEDGGESRQIKVSSVSASDVDNLGIGYSYLTARSGLRLRQATLDLAGPVTDHTATLFSESGALGGLFPWQRISVNDLPTSHFPDGAYDGFVQGWTENYTDDKANITFDLSLAPRTVGADTFTLSNGAAWASPWQSFVGSGGSITVQTNQGRISPGTTAAVTSYAKYNQGPYWTFDMTVTVTLVNSASTARVLYRYDSGFANGYYVELKASGLIMKRQGGAGNTITTASFTPTAGTQYKIRIINVGGWHGAFVWAASGSQPAEFTMKGVDSALAGQAGYVGLLAVQDGTTTSKAVDFDNFDLREAQL